MKFSKIFSWKRKVDKKPNETLITGNGGTSSPPSPPTTTAGVRVIPIRTPSIQIDPNAAFVPGRYYNASVLIHQYMPLQRLLGPDGSGASYPSTYSNPGSNTAFIAPAVPEPRSGSPREGISNAARSRLNWPTSTASGSSGSSAQRHSVTDAYGQAQRGASTQALVQDIAGHRGHASTSSTPPWPRTRPRFSATDEMVREAFSRPFHRQDDREGSHAEDDTGSYNDNIANEYLAELASIEPPWSRPATPSTSARSHTAMPPLSRVPQGRARFVGREASAQEAADLYRARTALLYNSDGEEEDIGSLQGLMDSLRRQTAEGRAGVQSDAEPGDGEEGNTVEAAEYGEEEENEEGEDGQGVELDSLMCQIC